MKCYYVALQISPADVSVLINKISCFRKQGNFTKALSICNKILNDNPMYNVALCHKERILFSLEQYNESILCCDSILKDILTTVMSYLINHLVS